MPAEPMLLAGTLDLLVLRTLAWGPRHGYAVARWIKDVSDETIEVEDRALYLAKSEGRNCVRRFRPEGDDRRDSWNHVPNHPAVMR